MSLEDALARIREETELEPRVGLVLGSGLGGLADDLEGRVEIAYSDIPGWPASTAVGHAGVLVLGSIDRVPVAVLKGRAHLYEGVPPHRAVFGVRVLRRLGVRTLVVTNAAGAIDESLRPGQLVLISDHVNLQAASPLVGPNDDELGPRIYGPCIAAQLARENFGRLPREQFVGQALERLAEHHEAAARRIERAEMKVRQPALAAAMAPFRGEHDEIERVQPLDLEPRGGPLAGFVRGR